MSEDGAVIVGGKQVASTNMCPHCGAHFTMKKGSGIRRAWCLRCSAVTCGKPECDACVPIEARFEFFSGKKTAYDDKIKELLASGARLL